MNTRAYFQALVRASKDGQARSICSVCSANAFVLEAALEEGKRHGGPLLIEATANQVNQFGGYIGMRPADFAAYVHKLARKVGFDPSLLILGGDHLGPLVWQDEPEQTAMRKAEGLIRAFAQAGFTKLHIDCSMRLGDDCPTAPLQAQTVARRAAQLAAVAQENATRDVVYVVGSEVPIPGGATEHNDQLEVTSAQALQEEYLAFREAFLARGLEQAWTCVAAIVVQPGVEFGNNQVFCYHSETAKPLVEAARQLDGVALEAHSTDYQPKLCLAEMRRDGFIIQKVGPALTFALTRALFSLEEIETHLFAGRSDVPLSRFAATLDEQMRKHPSSWRQHYSGDENACALMRRFSLSDRSRYYLETPEVRAAIARLMRNLETQSIPLGLLFQYFPRQASQVVSQTLKPDARILLKTQIQYVLRDYADA